MSGTETSRPFSGFHFRRFDVRHDSCAQKVSTDSVLLGSWADVSSSPHRVLDVGCGCGILSLMMAQRSEAHIVGVEIDALAAAQARENVAQSAWAERIEIVEGDICTYQSTELFDMIICNPPFYKEQTLPPNARKCLAHHSVSLPNEKLLHAFDRLLTAKGKACVIVPVNTENDWKCAAVLSHLTVVRRCVVNPKPQKAPHRVLLELAREARPLTTEYITIHNNEGQRTKEFAALTEMFYL